MELLERLPCSASGDSLLCVEVSLHCSSTVAVGTDSGAVVLLDTRSSNARPSHLLGGGAGGEGAPASSLAFHPSLPHALFASSGCCVVELDARRASSSLSSTSALSSSRAAVVRTLFTSDDDVAHVSLNAKGDLLAACDDCGDVTLVPLRTSQESSAAAALPPRTLRRHHSNCVAAAGFRPSRPGELVSVGLDGKVIRWECTAGTAGGGRLLRSWDAAEQLSDVAAREAAAAAAAAAAGGGGGGKAALAPSHACSVNPPLCHSVALCSRNGNGGERLAAVGCGDGSVLLINLDAKRGDVGAWALRCDATGGEPVHRRGCGHVSFPRFSLPASSSSEGDAAAAYPPLLSAGNDGSVVLWDWGAHVAGAARCARVAARGKCGGAVNWAASSGGGGTGGEGPPKVYVATTSNRLHVFAVR